MFPQWFAGIAFGAIPVGALVPAALMAIASANTFTRNIYRPYFRPAATDREEAFVSKLVSVVIKLGALGVLIGLNLSFALEFQLIGGVIIIEILPTLVLGLYTRWFHRWSLVSGWIVGMGLSVYMLYVTPSKSSAHFGSASFPFSTWGFDTKMTIWTGIVGLLANLIVAAALSPLFSRLPDGQDRTTRRLRGRGPRGAARGLSGTSPRCYVTGRPYRVGVADVGIFRTLTSPRRWAGVG